MSVEAPVVHQDPFIYGYKDYNYNINNGGYDHGFFPFQEEEPNPPNLDGYCDSPPPSLAHTAASSPETSGMSVGCRKRRRVKPTKNKEEMENQRVTHIAVERNRRRQMNDYLAVLRSIMPPSYAQRGDQASIVGGAINFVKELEQLNQFLEANNPITNPQQPNDNVFSNFFTFPQYSTCPSTAVDAAAERRSTVADVEVMMAERHACIKLSTKRRPKQLFKLVAGFQSIGFTILHLNITTVDQRVLYSFSVKGDQASIVGGAINFVKELEQLNQFLEANNPITNQQQPNDNVFSNFFTFPQYSTCPSTAVDAAAERRSTVADVEVMMVERHASIKLSTKRRPKQLLKLVAGFQSIGFTILHLNITTVDQLVLYSFSVKVEDECEVSTVNDIATTVHDIVEMIEEESICS